MRTRSLKTASRLAVLAVTLALVGGSARAELIYGLGATTASPNLLFSFDSATPGTNNVIGNISGLTTGSESVVGIDIRPLGGALFALTNDGGTGRLYTVNPATAAATFVATLSQPLAGTSFGMDFNPTGPVALRIVSNTGQNLRVGNPLTGATVVDTSLNAGITGVAYANNDNDGTTGTTIFYINTGTDFLQTAANPNLGPATNIGTGLGVDLGDALGFDISGFGGTAYAAVNVVGGSSSTFHTINLAAGTPSAGVAFNTALVGTVRGIAAPANIAPEPGTVALLGIGVGLMALRLRRRTA